MRSADFSWTSPGPAASDRPARRRLVALLSSVILAAVPGCREDASPTAPESEPALTTATTAAALAFREVSASSGHACGVTTDNRAYCWGLNDSGELGTGNAAEATRPVAAAPSLRFLYTREGAGYTCGLTTENQIYCWGLNTDGQLGDGTNSQYSLEPVRLAGGRRYRELRAGAAHACAITLAGVTLCWGSNQYGQLGDGTTIERRAPVRVAGGIEFIHVSTGGFHTCGLNGAKKAYCWGLNSTGQIGDRTSLTRLRPAPVWGGLAFNTVSAGGAHTCGVGTDHQAYCWGWNKYGTLGDGTTNRHSRPLPVVGGLTFSGVSAGAAHTCGVTTTKRAYCWGYNWYGQVGDGTDATDGVVMRPSPTRVAGGLLFESVFAAGGRFANYTCGVTTDSRGYCWGENSHGYLGDGTTTNRSTPTPIASPL
jgi:alpha-tubulin suppressor-like RCC1 family protein